MKANFGDSEIGADGERIYPHWDCPRCDAPNAGAEQCDPSRRRVRCDECNALMVYRGDYGHDRDCARYNFAHITTEDARFDEECPVSVAERLLDAGLITFDGVVTHGSAAEYLYTARRRDTRRILREIAALMPEGHR